MRDVSIVSKRIMRIMGVSLAYHDLKLEFLNSFESLSAQRIISIMFMRVSLFNYTAIFKKNKYRRLRPYKELIPSGASNVSVLQRFGERNQLNEG
jgi:hypothetical protein